MHHLLQHFDYATSLAVTQAVRGHLLLTKVAYILAELLIFVYPLVLYIMWQLPEVRSHRHASRKAVVLALMGVVIGLAIKGFITVFFVRARPYITHPDIWHFRVDTDPASFPSSHSLIAFVIAFSLLWSGYKRIGIGLLILAFLVAAGRVMIGVHYPTDVIAGAVFAFILAWYLHREAGGLKRYLPDE